MIESKRLLLRKITPDDFEELAKMLKDIDVMYAWEHTFADEQINDWIYNQMKRYDEDGIGFLLAIDKNLNQVVGQIGLLRLSIKEEKYWETGYILLKEHWGKGYATEGAKACLDYAFHVLNVEKVICDIRPHNLKSIAVAKRLGMIKKGEHVKHYNGQDMLHEIFEINKAEYQKYRVDRGG